MQLVLKQSEIRMEPAGNHAFTFLLLSDESNMGKGKTHPPCMIMRIMQI